MVDADDVIAPGSEEEYALAALDALLATTAGARHKRRGGIRPTRDAAIAPETVTCARCYSLRHYGVVKNEAEILMPSFDFKRVIGSRLDRLGSERRRRVAGDRRDGFRPPASREDAVDAACIRTC